MFDGKIFDGKDPFGIVRSWLSEASVSEPNDPNAVALATVDEAGLPNVRMVLLKEVEDDAFVFYTNYESAKAQELSACAKAAFVLHWKSLRRQIRVRGHISLENGEKADEYFKTRSLKSRLGAWASEQSRPLGSRAELLERVAKVAVKKGINPDRPPFWGGYRIKPVEIEFWADGAARLHDRFRWTKETENSAWTTQRLYP